jgi:hypothetical protein
MMWELYLTLMVLASACTGTVFVLRTAIIPVGLIGTSIWSILMYQARNIVIYHGIGGETTVQSPSWQFVSLGLALLLLTAVILHYFGVFPPDGETADATLDAPDPDQQDQGQSSQRPPA